MSMERTIRLCALSAIVAVMVSGCGSHQAADAPPPVPMGIIYSPNGEPLSGGPLGHPTCAAAMSEWFDRVDANHDGMIDLDEFLADTRRQFAAMDLNHDGVVTPGELYTYRQPYGQDLVFVAAPDSDSNAPGGKSKPDRYHDIVTTTAPGNGPANRADPVMAADVKLRFQVSLADFLAYAQDQFTTLNRSHSGRLTKAEVQRSCGAL